MSIHSGYLYNTLSKNLLRGALSPATAKEKCLKTLAERRHIIAVQKAQHGVHPKWKEGVKKPGFLVDVINGWPVILQLQSTYMYIEKWTIFVFIMLWCTGICKHHSQLFEEHKKSNKCSTSARLFLFLKLLIISAFFYHCSWSTNGSDRSRLSSGGSLLLGLDATISFFSNGQTDSLASWKRDPRLVALANDEHIVQPEQKDYILEIQFPYPDNFNNIICISWNINIWLSAKFQRCS